MFARLFTLGSRPRLNDLEQSDCLCFTAGPSGGVVRLVAFSQETSESSSTGLPASWTGYYEYFTSRRRVWTPFIVAWDSSSRTETHGPMIVLEGGERVWIRARDSNGVAKARYYSVLVSKASVTSPGSLPDEGVLSCAQMLRARVRGDVSCSGGIMYLMNRYGEVGADGVPDCCFTELFDSRDVETGILTSGVARLPDLPSGDGAASGVACFACLSYNNPTLKQMPSLPAKAIGPLAFFKAFYACTALRSQGTNLAETIGNWGCGLLTTLTNIARAPKFPRCKTTLGVGALYKYCEDCFSLTSAVLPPFDGGGGPSGRNYRFASAFRRCSSLARIEVSYTAWPTGSSSDFYWWVGSDAGSGSGYEVAAEGEFVCPSGLELPSASVSAQPEGWTITRK